MDRNVGRGGLNRNIVPRNPSRRKRYVVAKSEDSIIAGIGCLAVFFYLVWVGVIVWAIIKLVSWITSQ